MSPTKEVQTPAEDNQTETGEATANRRDVVVRGALSLSAAAAVAALPAACAPMGGAASAASPSAGAQSGQPLYERLGGIFAIAGVVDHFSDAIIRDPVAGAQSRNPALREWHTRQLGRLPGLKFMRTLWVARVSGGPFEYSPTRPGSTNLGLEEAHKTLRISPEEFDAVAGVLSRSLDHFSVPQREKAEVLGAFAAHKDEVTKGWRDAR
jgi:hemoglobin